MSAPKLKLQHEADLTVIEKTTADKAADFPSETKRYMSWQAIRFINSPTSYMLDITCAILFMAFVTSIILGGIIQIDVSADGTAQIATDNGVREIASPMDGLITKTYKKTGDSVKENELIARIQIDEDTSKEVDSLANSVNLLTKKVETTRSTAELSVDATSVVYTTKISDSAVLQALANVEHSIRDFQVAKSLATKNSEIYYANKRLAFLNKRLAEMKASSQRKLLQTYIDSTEEEIGRLKTQVVSAQLKTTGTLDQGFSELLRTLRIASGALDDFRLHHEVRSPTNGIVGKIYEDRKHATINRSIATIIPSNSKFIAEIKMSSKDIVKIKKGQTVYYKVEAYPFQRYGLFVGEVLEIESFKEIKSEDKPETVTDNDDKFILKANIYVPENLSEELKKKIKFILGMRAQATVVMDRKTIDEIILEKFFNLKDL